MRLDTRVRVFLAALVCCGSLASAAPGAPRPKPFPADESAPAAEEPRDQVILKGGDILRGTITGSGADTVTIDHPQLGPISVPLDRVQSYGPIDPTSLEEAAKTATDIAAKAAEAAAPPKSPWDYYISLAFSGAFNVNDEFDLRAAAGLKYQDEGGKFTLDAEYYYRISNGSATDNDLLIRAIQEWYFKSSPWLLFAQGEYEYDDFEPWTNRVSAYFGPGYKVFDEENLKLTLRAGPGVSYYDGDVDDWRAEILFAEEFTWKISARQTLLANVSIAPNVEDFSDYRVEGRLEYALAIGETKKGVAMTFGLRDIYYSKPLGDGTNNDLRVYGGVRYDF